MHLPLVHGIRIECWNESAYFPAEDSLLLLEALQPGSGTLLDVGTGSGIVAIGAALLGYRVVATDILPGALICAVKNARLNAVNIDFMICDLASALSFEFDVITFNPPYLPDSNHPDPQLTGGELGYEIVLRLLEQCIHISHSGTEMFLVQSSRTVGHAVRALMEGGWSVIGRKCRKVEFETLELLTCRRIY